MSRPHSWEIHEGDTKGGPLLGRHWFQFDCFQLVKFFNSVSQLVFYNCHLHLLNNKGGGWERTWQWSWENQITILNWWRCFTEILLVCLVISFLQKFRPPLHYTREIWKYSHMNHYGIKASNQRNLKVLALHFRIDRKHFENWAFRQRFPSLQWSVIPAFSIFSAIVYMENIWCISRVKTSTQASTNHRRTKDLC